MDTDPEDRRISFDQRTPLYRKTPIRRENKAAAERWRFRNFKFGNTPRPWAINILIVQRGIFCGICPLYGSFVFILPSSPVFMYILKTNDRGRDTRQMSPLAGTNLNPALYPTSSCNSPHFSLVTAASCIGVQQGRIILRATFFRWSFLYEKDVIRCATSGVHLKTGNIPKARYVCALSD